MNTRTLHRQPSRRSRPDGPYLAGWIGRVAALAGVGSAVLTFAGYLIIGPNPDSDASTSTITAYYAAHHADVFRAGMVLGYAAVLLAVFGIAVWARIRQTALHPVVAGTALVATAIAAVSDGMVATSWYMLGAIGNTHAAAPGAIQTLHLSVSAGDLPGACGLGVLLVMVALAGIVASAFPRWIAWSALVLGILHIAPTPGVFGFFTGLAILPWMCATGITMFLRPGEAEQAPGRVPSTTASPATS
ncbi:MAG TPA: hypothetical protein VE777_11065 [Gaiellales bacterium]|jgi:hypothetical protein|nr:hypothetical protein [Gaiellales bacterium]